MSGSEFLLVPITLLFFSVFGIVSFLRQILNNVFCVSGALVGIGGRVASKTDMLLAFLKRWNGTVE